MKVVALYDGKQLIGNMPVINCPIRILVEFPDEIVSSKGKLSPSTRLELILGDVEMPVFINETEEYQTYLESKYL